MIKKKDMFIEKYLTMNLVVVLPQDASKIFT